MRVKTLKNSHWDRVINKILIFEFSDIFARSLRHWSLMSSVKQALKYYTDFLVLFFFYLTIFTSQWLLICFTSQKSLDISSYSEAGSFYITWCLINMYTFLDWSGHIDADQSHSYNCVKRGALSSDAIRKV